MPIKINGHEYLRTNEACVLAGITKNTFLRWVANGSYRDVARRDRRGWRLFTKEDVERLRMEVNKVQVEQSKTVQVHLRADQVTNMGTIHKNEQ